MSSLSLCVCVGLFLLCLYYIKAHKQHVYHRPGEIEETPLRDPACIALSQEETSNDFCDQPAVPHTPVEESSTGIQVIIPKQETSERIDKLYENDLDCIV